MHPAGDSGVFFWGVAVQGTSSGALIQFGATFSMKAWRRDNVCDLFLLHAFVEKGARSDG